jgi:hypothetical protein
MSDPAWLPYVGVVTGAVGMITGVTGMVISIANYRRVSRMKALDLRLELRTISNATRATLDGLPDLIGRAEESRNRALTPVGHGPGSGAHILWTTACTADREAVEALRARLPDAGEDFSTLSPVELASKLLDMRDLNAKGMGLRDKYNNALAADDRTREQTRAEHSAVALARMTGRIPG